MNHSVCFVEWLIRCWISIVSTPRTGAVRFAQLKHAYIYSVTASMWNFIQSLYIISQFLGWLGDTMVAPVVVGYIILTSISPATPQII